MTISNLKSKESTSLIYGKNSVLEALDAASISKIWIAEESRDPRTKEIEDIARSKKVPVMRVKKSKLKQIANTEDHRSVVAQIIPIELKDEEFLFREDVQRILIPSNIQDPHNLGAIIRTAYAFGFDAIAVSNRKSVQINETVITSSSGAAFKMPIVRIGNATQCIEKLKKKNFWVYGANNSPEAQNLNDVKFDSKTVIIMGSEGAGIPEMLAKHCDFTVKIPIKFESLNVSVAAGVILSKVFADSQA